MHTYQYWKNVTRRFEGCDSSEGMFCSLGDILLLGEGGILVSVCECASVVTKLRFK